MCSHTRYSNAVQTLYVYRLYQRMSQDGHRCNALGFQVDGREKNGEESYGSRSLSDSGG